MPYNLLSLLLIALALTWADAAYPASRPSAPPPAVDAIEPSSEAVRLRCDLIFCEQGLVGTVSRLLRKQA
jgi:hypothetical protein